MRDDAKMKLRLSLGEPIESVKTTSMENGSTGVLDKDKEHNLRYKDISKKSHDVLRHIQLHMPKYKTN